MTQAKQKSAFTLIEVMVATVIMVVLVGMVITITARVMDVWSQSTGKLAANAEARIAMELITQDLETAVFRKNKQQWLRAEAMAAVGGMSEQTVGLYLFSPAMDRPDKDTVPGDVCAIAYRLAFKESYDGGPDTFALYRMVVNAEDTFNDYLGSQSDPGSPQKEIGENSSADWTQGTVTSNENYLVGNIVEFKVLLYEEDGTSSPQPVNANSDFILSGTPYTFGGEVSDPSSGTSIESDTTRLLYADVILKVVSDEGLEILSLPSFIGTGFEDADHVLDEHGQTFTRRIFFPANPL